MCLPKIHKIKLGQSALEYTMLIALAATSIILMNRYVFRSLFAGIKMWEDQINFSVSEEYPVVEAFVGAGAGCPRFVGFKVTGCFPNPFDPSTNFDIQLMNQQSVIIQVRGGGRNEEVTVTNDNCNITFSPPDKWSYRGLVKYAGEDWFKITYTPGGATSSLTFYFNIAGNLAAEKDCTYGR